METLLPQTIDNSNRGLEKKIFSFTSILIAVFFMSTSLTYAQLGTDTFVIASDEASTSNYPGGTWNNSTNGGTGFGAWSFNFNNGGSYIGNTGQGDPSFGLFSDGGSGNFSFAERVFSRAMQPGDTFSVELGHSTTIGGEIFLQFLDSSTPVFTLKFVTGDTEWRINDGGTDFGSGQAYDDFTSITFTFTYEGGNDYSYTFGTGSGSNFTATSTISNITSVKFQSTDQGSGENFGFNNLEITSKYTIPNGQSSNVTSNTTAPYLEVQNGGSVVVEPNNVLTIDGNLINEGSITFQSDATGTAQLDTFTGNLSGSGDYTVERYIPAERAFRLLASPVTTSGTIFDNWQEGGIYPTSENNIGTHITGVQGTVGQFDAATGLDQTASGNPSMFTFDNAYTDPLSGTDQSGAWQAVTSTNQTGDILNAEMPYLLFVRGDRSIDLSSNSSTPTNTTLSATGTLFTNSSSTQSLSDQPEYFSLVANPFQAIVDFNALTFTGLGNSNFMYVYDPTQKDYETLETGTNDADMFIRPGQSVFVVNNTGSVTTSTVEIEQVDINTSPTPGPSTTVFNENQIANLELKLYNDTNDLRENLRIRFEDNASNAIDSFDAPKLMGTSENLASINSGNIYTIERRASVQDTDNVPLHLDQYQGNNYEFRLNLDNWNSDIEIFIADNYLNNQTLITPNQGYSFTVDQNIPESIAENRFSLVFDNTTLGVDDNTFGANFKLYPNPSPNGQFHIKTPNLSGEVNVEISNLLGQQVSVQKLSIEEQQVNVNAENLSSGIYLVKLSQDNQSFSTKLMVE